MLFVTLSQILEDPFRGFVTLATFSLALVVALTFHEYSHALVSTRLGDPTARSLGRLSLHPKAHLDPTGAIMIFLAGFGWAKPVPVNPANLQMGERSGMAVVALAGPLSNVLLAALFAIPIRSGVVAAGSLGFSEFLGQVEGIPAYFVGSVVFWNLLLASFNLIPVAPLDGFRVALGILPKDAASAFARLERYGPAILVMVILFGLLLPGPGILFRVVRPVLNLLSWVVLGGQLL